MRACPNGGQWRKSPFLIEFENALQFAGRFFWLRPKSFDQSDDGVAQAIS
jgi:hypothetical protein